MKFIYLVRHGENDVMARHLAGRLPGTFLNEKGRTQADALAKRLAAEPIKAIFSSPLERALQTAAPLAAVLNLPVLPLEGLIEIDYGSWQGRTYKDLARTNLWKQVHGSASTIRFPGGESFSEVQARAQEAMSTVAAAVGEKEIAVCFTHGDIIRLVTAHYLNMALDDFQRLHVDTGSCTVIQLTDGQPARVLRVNQSIE